MADTFSGLIDKLITVDLKISHNQNTFKDISEIDFQCYRQKYFNDVGANNIWKDIQKLGDLFLQRDQLIIEIVEKVNEMIAAAKSGEDLDSGKFIQRKHKTY